MVFLAGTSRSGIGYELVLAGYDLVGYEMDWVQLDHLPIYSGMTVRATTSASGTAAAKAAMSAGLSAVVCSVCIHCIT